jgi:hypothetical protein
MKFRAMWVLCLVLAPITFLNADTLELKNGSVIKGAYVGGSDTRIRFRVGSTVQEYAIADITSLKFDARESAAPARTPGFDDRSPAERSPDERSPDERSPENGTRQRAPESYSSSPAPQASVPNSTAASTSIPRATSQSIVVPSGTRVTIRTIDGVDSDKNHPGDKFLASLEQSLIVNDVTIAPKGASVYGKLQQVQEAGQLTGKSQLRLALTGIVINGQTYPLSSGDYEISGKSRGTSTATKVGGGAALGAVIGAIAGGGRGAAIGAGVGAGAGTAVQVVTKGDQVHVPSETLLEFTLDQPVSLPVNQGR